MKVLATSWNVSTMYPTVNWDNPSKPIMKAKLSVYRFPNGTSGEIEYHPEYYGMMFDSVDEAREFAFSVGLTKEISNVYSS